MERWPIGTVSPVLLLASLPAALRSLAPGLAVVSALAMAAWSAASVAAALGVAVEPSLLALLFGLAAAQCGTPAPALQPGIVCAGRTLLRGGVVLSGWRLGLVPFASLGLGDLLGVALLVASTVLVGRAFARWLGVDRELGLLLAAGHAICGASAIVATEAVASSHPRKAPVAIVLVTLAGTALLLVLPWLARAFALSPTAYGTWAGGSLHEVAQALAAGQAGGDASGAMATVFKLARVLCLVPWLLLVPRLAVGAKHAMAPRAPRPWFVAGFVVVGAAAATGVLPAAAWPSLRGAQSVLMVVAMAALGLQAPLRALREVGGRALLLTFLLTLFVTAAGLGLALLA